MWKKSSMAGKKEAGIGTRISYWILLGVCRFVGILPTWFLYHCLLDVMYFFMYKVGNYRVKVVRTNLLLAFPEKTEEERRGIEKRFYYHLAEIMVDTIDFMSITQKQAARRLVIEDIAAHEESVDGMNWIAALAHYGSWEYFSAYPLFTQSQTASSYHPLNNKAVDILMLKARTRFGMKLVPMRELTRFVAGNSDTTDGNYALGMILDQSPRGISSYAWLRFLGQPTRFFTSMEKFAVKYNMKVYFFHMEKPSRGHYRGHFEMIYDGHGKIEEGDIALRYAERLERQIRACPELWLWSHRRWKHKVPDDVAEQLAAGRKIVLPTAKKK